MVRIELRYEGNLRCEAAHGPSGAKLVTDAPVDNHGQGQAFSPTDLVAAALGACVTTMMGIVAERDGISLDGLRVQVEKEMVADPHRRIGRLAVEVRMPEGLSPGQRKKLEATARLCPVRQSLSPAVETPLTFIYPREAGSPRTV